MQTIAAYRRTCSPSRLAWSEVRQLLALFYIHQMNWVNSRNDYDSTINIVDIIIIIIHDDQQSLFTA